MLKFAVTDSRRIVEIIDGKVKDFVDNLDNWKGDPDCQAINVTTELVAHDGVRFNQIFTYREEDGKTTYTASSNLGKYKKKYDKLPETGDLVKVQTSAEGFPKLKIE